MDIVEHAGGIVPHKSFSSIKLFFKNIDID